MTDEVNMYNELKWRQQFCDESGHTIECVEETIDDMLLLMAKTYLTHGIPEYEANLSAMDQTTIDQFEKHLRSILSQKECDCHESMGSTNTH